MAKKSWTNKELSELKQMITKKRKLLLDEILESKDKADEILKSSTSNALYSSHMADASSDHVELEKALDMIKNKTFGVCQVCNELINKERLEEVPHTTKCFDCKNDR